MRSRSFFNTQHVAQDGQKRTTCCAQQCCDMLRSNAAIVWLELANAEPTMLGYVVLKYCDRLAGVLLEECCED